MSEIAVSLLLVAGVVAAMWMIVVFGKQRRGLYAVLAALAGLVCVLGLVSLRAGKPGGQLPTPLLRPSFSPIVSRTPKFVNFDARKYKGATGKITVPGAKNARIMLVPASGDLAGQFLSARTSDGTFVLPVGEYGVVSLTQTVKANGVDWTLSSQYDRLLTVARGSVPTLNVGQPLTASVKVSQSGRNQISMDLAIVGRGGETCSISRSGNSKPTQFQVSRAGKVLWTGAFEAG